IELNCLTRLQIFQAIGAREGAEFFIEAVVFCVDDHDVTDFREARRAFWRRSGTGDGHPSANCGCGECRRDKHESLHNFPHFPVWWFQSRDFRYATPLDEPASSREETVGEMDYMTVTIGLDCV